MVEPTCSECEGLWEVYKRAARSHMIGKNDES
jgi:hypothetical protein